jgi:hypothetical protein
MFRAPKLVAAAALLVLPACYHTVIDTGLTPSTQVIEKAWASGWIHGLIPPSPVQTMSQCPNGVSRVETQLRFANQLVNLLTVGIYSPMWIKVTCASSARSAAPYTPEVRVGENPTPQSVIDAFRHAADLSVKTGRPVLVRF